MTRRISGVNLVLNNHCLSFLLTMECIFHYDKANFLLLCHFPEKRKKQQQQQQTKTKKKRVEAIDKSRYFSCMQLQQLIFFVTSELSDIILFVISLKKKTDERLQNTLSP